MKKYWKNQPLSNRRLATSASSPVKNRAILFKKNDDRFPPYVPLLSPSKGKADFLAHWRFASYPFRWERALGRKTHPLPFSTYQSDPPHLFMYVNLLKILHILQLSFFYRDLQQSLMCIFHSLKRCTLGSAGLYVSTLQQKFHLMWKTILTLTKSRTPSFFRKCHLFKSSRWIGSVSMKSIFSWCNPSKLSHSPISLYWCQRCTPVFG